MLSFKNILIISAGGFVFSFFFSLIGGNSFFVIVKKSVIGSILFTIVASAAFIILKNIIDLQKTGNDNSSLSQNRNDDDNIAIDYEFEKNAADENILQQVDTGKLYDDDEEVMSDNFIEEVEEESVGDISMLDSLDSSDEIVEVMSDSDNNLDNDLIPERKSSSSFSERRNNAIDSLGDNLDAGTMAKAIKTILSRDHKG